MSNLNPSKEKLFKISFGSNKIFFWVKWLRLVSRWTYCSWILNELNINWILSLQLEPHEWSGQSPTINYKYMHKIRKMFVYSSIPLGSLFQLLYSIEFLPGLSHNWAAPAAPGRRSLAHRVLAWHLNKKKCVRMKIIN